MNNEFVVLNINGEKINELLHMLEEYKDVLIIKNDEAKTKEVEEMIKTLENNTRFFEETECLDEI